MSGKAITLVCAALAVLGRAAAEPPSDTEKKLMNTLMQKAVLVSVMNVANPEVFQEDTDPNTLQIVFLADPNAKPRVSDTGEVVFMSADISITDQGYLTQEAFLRKARRIMAGKITPP